MLISQVSFSSVTSQRCHVENGCHRTRKQHLFAGCLGWDLPAVFTAMDLGIGLNTFWAKISGIVYWWLLQVLSTILCDGTRCLHRQDQEIWFYWAFSGPTGLLPFQPSVQLGLGPKPLPSLSSFSSTERHEKTSVPVLAAALQIICVLFHLILLWDLKYPILCSPLPTLMLGEVNQCGHKKGLLSPVNMEEILKTWSMHSLKFSEHVKKKYSAKKKKRQWHTSREMQILMRGRDQGVCSHCFEGKGPWH